MKKYLALLVLMVGLSSPAHAYYCAPPAAATGATGSGGAAFIPFAGAVGLMLAVIYLNAEGVPFPLCDVEKCYYTFPTDKNGG